MIKSMHQSLHNRPHSANRQTRYVVDLQSYMAECEANYLRLMKLAPFDDDSATYQLQLPNNQQVSIQFSVTERCKYTTMMLVKQQGIINGLNTTWLKDNFFELRIYHDAQMVEVVGYQHHRQIKPTYQYPNEKMYQRDEKFQIHQFLTECLSYCLKNGLSENKVFTL